MAKKKYVRLAKWATKEATALKSLLTKKQVKRLKKAETISVDLTDGCIYAIIFNGNSIDGDAQEIMEKCSPRWFKSTPLDVYLQRKAQIKKKHSTKQYGYSNFSCIEVAIMCMPPKDIENLVNFLTDKKEELILNPGDWEYEKHGTVFQLG